MKKWKILLTIVLTLLIIPVAAGAIYVNFILDKVTVDDEEFDKDFDLMTNENLKESDIKNIALFKSFLIFAPNILVMTTTTVPTILKIIFCSIKINILSLFI